MATKKAIKSIGFDKESKEVAIFNKNADIETETRLAKWKIPVSEAEIVPDSVIIPKLGKLTTPEEAKLSLESRKLKSGLNKEQRAVVEDRSPALLAVSAAGSGKCIANSLVSTKYGLIYIDKFQKYADAENKCVIPITTYDERGNFRKIKTSHWFNMGLQEVKVVTTDSGYEIKGTPEHPVLILNEDGDLEFKQCKDIVSGDVVAISKVGIFSEKDRMSEAEARLAGLLVAKGYINNYEDTINFSSDSQSIVNKFYSLIADINNTLSVHRIIDFNGEKSDEFQVRDASLSKRMESIGINLENPQEHIPYTVFISSIKIVRAFLQSYLDCVAEVTPNEIVFIVPDKVMSIELQTLFLQLGIRVQREVKPMANHINWFKMSIKGQSAKRFYTEMGFNANTANNNKLKKHLGNIASKRSIIPNLSKRIEKLKVECPEPNLVRYIDNIKYLNSLTFKDMLTFVPKKYHGNPNFLVLHNYSNNFFFEEVKTISRDKDIVYDFTVPKLHSFIANGFINHNTKVLVERTISIIKEGHVDPSRIALITFTVKAAEEMRTRIAKALGDKQIASMITCGTFHSWCHRLMRRNYDVFGLHKNFTLWDNEDSLSAWRGCFTLLNLPIKRCKTFYNIYSSMRNLDISAIEAFKRRFSDEFDINDERTLLAFDGVVRKYERLKKEFSTVDFDDLLIMVERELRCNKDFRRRVSSKYKHVLIDEVQDSNKTQISMIYNLLRGSKENIEANSRIFKEPLNIFACGDEAQSIYAFRGADYTQMMSFPEKFGAKVNILSTNYRSSQQILDFANAIADNFTTVRWKKQMKGTYDGVKPIFIRLIDEYYQANFIADTIEDMIFNRKFKGKEIAVLYRANSSSREIEFALMQKNIEFIKLGGLEFIEGAHIKDVMSFIRVAICHSDPIGWLRMLMLHQNIGKEKSNQVFTACMDSIKSGRSPFSVLVNNTHGVKADFSKLGYLLSKVARMNTRPQEALELVINYYMDFLIRQNRNNERRLKMKKGDLNYLCVIASRMHSLKHMITNFSLKNTKNKDEDNKLVEEKQGGHVTLSSCHSVKGLEYDTVFIIDCNEPKFPNRFLMYNGNPPKCYDIVPEEDPQDKVDEERRLFYVACTRARHNLIISAPMDTLEYDSYIDNKGKIEEGYLTQSRFISEIENIEELATVIMPEIPTNLNHRLHKEYE